MILAPDAQKFLEMVMGAPPLDTQSAEQNRIDLTGAIPLTGDPRPLHHVQDIEIAGVKVRVYQPRESSTVLPAVVYFHGGGWIMGDLDLADTTVRDISFHADAIAISVDYRLAPEHPFPAALEDALAVTRSVLDGSSGIQLDTSRVAVAGDSAGGNLASLVSQQLRDHQPGLVHQVLIYPVTDLSATDTPSQHEFNEGYFLTGRDLEHMYRNYATDQDRGQPRLSPAQNRDLAGLPSATVITAECDPLRDQGEAYARAMQDAGNTVTAVRFNGQVHPFVYLGGVIQDAGAARRFIGAQLTQAFL